MTERVASLVQILTLIAVIALGVVVMWLSLTGRDFAAERAQDDARLQFQLTVADICATTGVLSRTEEQRTAERVQEIVDDCLAQVNTAVSIDVPNDQ